MKIVSSSLVKTLSILLLSAIISLSCSNDDDDDNANTNLAKLKIATKQCKEPWQEVQGDNLKNQVTTYLKNLNIELKGFQDITSDDISFCEACEICPGPSIIITVDKTHIDRLLEEGFIVVTD